MNPSSLGSGSPLGMMRLPKAVARAMSATITRAMMLAGEQGLLTIIVGARIVSRKQGLMATWMVM